MAKTIITYGTFDLFHVGHLRLLERARALGERLVVGVSTDEFNAVKGKKTFIDFSHRLEIVRSLRCVDAVFPETCWEQKRADAARYKAGTLVMGSDWMGKFDFLKDQCEVVYLPRTARVSSTSLRNGLAALSALQSEKARKVLEIFAAAIQVAQSDGPRGDTDLVDVCHQCRQSRLLLFHEAERHIN